MRSSRLFTLLTVLVASGVLGAPRTALADEMPSPVGPFAAGRANLFVGFGRYTLDRESYLLAMVGGGYFVSDGFELSLDAAHLFSSDPSLWSLAPSVRYVLFQTPLPAKPFAGLLYRRWIVAEYPDRANVGARGGLVSVDRKSVV